MRPLSIGLLLTPLLALLGCFEPNSSASDADMEEASDCEALDTCAEAQDMSRDTPDQGSTRPTTDAAADLATPPTMPDMSVSPPRRDMSTTPPVEPDMSMPMPDPPKDPCQSVSACTSGDACCPAGCGAAQDDDCAIDCDDFEGWPANYAALEQGVLQEINAHRAQGADCGSKGSFAAAGPVAMNRELQVAARCHSVDMVVNLKRLNHTGSDGSSFSARARSKGYSGTPRGENIAAGNATAKDTVNQWMNSDGHCANIMNAGIDRVGVGYFTGNVRYTHYWTLVTGRGGDAL